MCFSRFILIFLSLLLSLSPQLCSAPKIRVCVENVCGPNTHGIGEWREGRQNKGGLTKKEQMLISSDRLDSSVSVQSCSLGHLHHSQQRLNVVAVVKHSHWTTGATVVVVVKCEPESAEKGKDEIWLPLQKCKQQHITSQASFAWWQPMIHMSEMIRLTMSARSENLYALAFPQTKEFGED